MKCTEPPSSKMELKCVGVDTFKLLSQDWDLLAVSSDVRVGDQTTWGESERPRFKSQACQFTTYGTWAKLLNLYEHSQSGQYTFLINIIDENYI